MGAGDRIGSHHLVGRVDELGGLRRAAAEAERGAGRCVLIAGEAGIGKTRLLAEVRASIAWRVLECRCYEEDPAFPFAPLQAGLRELLRMSDRAETELFERRAGSLARLLPELIERDGPSPTEGGDPAARQRAMFEAAAGLLFDLAARQPLLVTFEDLHWADESTLLFVRFLARRLAGRALLLVGTFRADGITAPLADLLLALEREHLAEQISLAPLTRSEVDALLRSFFEGSRLAPAATSPDFLDAVTSLSEGNPLYVEELVRGMVQAGDIYRDDTVWVRKAGAELRVPASVQDAVRRQSEGLTPESRRVLALAAIAGRESDFELLAQVTGLPEAALVARLKDLVAAGLISEERPDVFAFRHALLREAVQGQLLARERRALHTQVAAALERGHAADAEAHAAELSYHSYEAGEWERALVHARRAGEQARQIDATREALAQYTRAVAASGHLGAGPEPDLLLERAELYEQVGEFDLAAADLDAALAAAERAGRQRESWEALLKLGYLWAARDYSKSLDWFERALAAPEAAANPMARAETLNRIGNVYLNRDQPATALPYHEAALIAFEAAGDLAGQANTLELMGVCYYNIPNVLEGARCEERALGLAGEAGARSVVFHASIHLLLPLRFETEVGPPVQGERLIGLGEAALGLARAMNWPGGEGQALGLLGGFHGLLGHYDRALACLNEGLQLAARFEYVAGVAAAERMIAAVLIELFAFDDAADRLRRAWAAAGAAGAGLFADIAALALIQTLVARRGPGDLAEAGGLLTGMLADGKLAGGRLEREALALRAELELAQGRPASGLATLDGVLETTRHLAEHGLVAVPRLALLRGQALVALGRNEEARESLQAALNGAASQCRKPLLWRAHSTMGRLMLNKKERRAAWEQFEQARTLIAELAATVPDRDLRDGFLRKALASVPAAPARTGRRAVILAHYGLTERERSVAKLVSLGRSNREIADALIISERTAERHVANILTKLGLASRVQLAAWVTEHLPEA